MLLQKRVKPIFTIQAKDNFAIHTARLKFTSGLCHAKSMQLVPCLWTYCTQFSCDHAHSLHDNYYITWEIFMSRFYLKQFPCFSLFIVLIVCE